MLTIIGLLLLARPLQAGTLSCVVAESCDAGTVIYRMSGTANAHAELPSGSDYAQLVCCSGVAGLGNTCAGTFATALKLSAATNAHAERSTQENYAESACISVADGSVSVGYQSTNCDGFDTTLGSMSGVTNAHVGDGTAYTTKICATASTAGSVTVDIVEADGDTVVAPSVGMGAVTFSFPFQTATGTFGVADQKIRIDNATGNAQWTLTVAADVGAAATWSAGATEYDFNDPTASAGDGGDADSVGGQMTVDASGGTITPDDGCASTGLTLGSSAAFSEGVTDSVTLLTAGGTADTGCFWDLTGIAISQTIPAEQAAGSYSLDMTLTVTAI